MTDSLLEIAILAPIPLEHLESGKTIDETTGFVAFGTNKWELFQKIDSLKGHARTAVLIYPSWGTELVDTGFKVSWFGWYHGHTHSKGGAHPDGLTHRPPTTSSYPKDNAGHWAAFWHIKRLRRLPKEKQISISKIATIKDGWRKNAPPHGPELVALPELLSYED